MEKQVLPWKSIKDGFLPEKTGKVNYEHVGCLVIDNSGEMRILMWNCEERYWDDEEGDDYECDADGVQYFLPLSEIPIPGEIKP